MSRAARDGGVVSDCPASEELPVGHEAFTERRTIDRRDADPAGDDVALVEEPVAVRAPDENGATAQVDVLGWPPFRVADRIEDEIAVVGREQAVRSPRRACRLRIRPSRPRLVTGMSKVEEVVEAGDE